MPLVLVLPLVLLLLLSSLLVQACKHQGAVGVVLQLLAQAVGTPQRMVAMQRSPQAAHAGPQA